MPYDGDSSRWGSRCHTLLHLPELLFLRALPVASCHVMGCGTARVFSQVFSSDSIGLQIPFLVHLAARGLQRLSGSQWFCDFFERLCVFRVVFRDGSDWSQIVGDIWSMVVC